MLYAVLLTGPAAMLAIEFGWFLTEVGRQPWIVRGYMRVSEAATQAGGITLVTILFGLLYLVLLFTSAYVLIRMFKDKPAQDDVDKVIEKRRSCLMDYTTIGITVLWTFLFLYIIVASIDFGAGFFTLHTKLTGEEKKINHLVERYLNPVWEVTNVFFVFFFVGFVGFFPDSALYFGTVLLVPGSIALILISIRGSFYAFEHYGQDTKLPWIIMYGLTGLLIPASLATVLTISEGGYITERGSHFDLDWFQLLLSPFAWSVVFLAIISVLYISSGFFNILCFES